MIKKIALILIFSLHSTLYAYNVVIAGEAACGDKSYLEEGRKSHRVMNTVLEAWWQIIKELERSGVTTTVISRDNLHLHTSADLFIFWDMPNFANFHLIKDIADKSFVVLCEPTSVIHAQYNPKMLNQFKRVFTWDDAFAQENNYIKYCLPVLKSYKGAVPFEQKKLACMMCSNRYSCVAQEMYSERRKIINFFTNQNPSLFDLYGPGWSNIATHKGMAHDKLFCLDKYVFNFCLENTRDTTGYITEKIFDAMEAGAIPIYTGACNIDEYIPRNCYIAYESFKSLEELKKYMCGFTEQQYLEYQKKIRSYLESPQAQRFAIPAYVQLFMNEIRQFLCA